MKPDESLPDEVQEARKEASVPTEETASWYTPYIEAGKRTGAIRGEKFENVKKARQRKEAELSRRREVKEISPHNFDLNFIFRLNEIDAPLTRKDVVHETGNQPVVIDREELEALGCIDFIHASGERMVVEAESLRDGDVLILYPEELGDEEKT